MIIEGNIAEKASGLAALLARLQAQLKTNQRAALGLLVLGLLLAGYGLMALDDSVAARRAQYIEATHRLERLVASGSETEWPQRAAASAALRKSLEGRLWSGDSEGIVQADLQDWVTSQARQAGLHRVQVSLEMVKPQGSASGVRQIIATIRALDTESAAIEFLARIKREPRLLVVDHLKIQELPVHSMEMKLIAYAVVKAGGPAAQ